jgi:nucleoside-diphosphate-sugar epimerase
MNNHQNKPLVVVTGSSGLIGARLIEALKEDYQVSGLDIVPPEEAIVGTTWTECDLTDTASVGSALYSVEQAFGKQIASVVHLAAYYDFSGEQSPLYHELTVEGTRRLLKQLQMFEVEQFIFSSSLLVMKSADEDETLTAMSPTEAEWEYPKSKLAAEQVIREECQSIPTLILRIAGVYDEDCHSIPLAQQISRIYEKRLEGFVFPGDKHHGQAFIHIDDLIACFRQAIKCRHHLIPHEIFLIGDEDVMSYAELQEELGTMIHGKKWPTIRIPKVIAKAGAWAKDKLAGGEVEASFIKPWMIDLADQHYPVNIMRAREHLRWEPKRSLRHALPDMIGRLQFDPRRWYEVNALPLPAEMAEDSSCEHE